MVRASLAYDQVGHSLRNSCLFVCLFVSVFVNNQLDAQFSFHIFVYSNSLHVSSNQVLIIRRVNCINMTSGICHCM